jgi:hypothetical protein
MVERGRGKMADRLVVLQFTARKTGRAFEIPIGHRVIDGRMAILTNSRWRHNFAGGADIVVKRKGQAIPARAELLDDPDEVALIYNRLIGEIGWEKAGRQLGIKINDGRRPTREELEAMIRKSGLSVVWLDPRDETQARPAL